MIPGVLTEEMMEAERFHMRDTNFDYFSPEHNSIGSRTMRALRRALPIWENKRASDEVILEKYRRHVLKQGFREKRNKDSAVYRGIEFIGLGGVFSDVLGVTVDSFDIGYELEKARRGDDIVTEILVRKGLGGR